MRRFSGIFVLTTLLFAAGSVVFFTKAAALPYKVAYPVLLLGLSTFLLRRKELYLIGLAFLLSAAGDVMGRPALVYPPDGVFRTGACRLYSLVSAPGAAHSPHRVVGRRRAAACVLVRRHRSPGSVSGRMYRRSCLWVAHRGMLYSVSNTMGLRRRVPLRGLVVRLFRRGDRLEPLRRSCPSPYMGRDDYLLPGSISFFPVRPHNSGFTCGG